MYINKIGKGEKPNNRNTKLYRCRAKYTKNIFKNNEKNQWIDEKKFRVTMGQIYEIGKTNKYYAKNNTKQI